VTTREFALNRDPGSSGPCCLSTREASGEVSASSFVDYSGKKPRMVDASTGKVTEVELAVVALGAP
jgi:hypothetical protein